MRSAEPYAPARQRARHAVHRTHGASRLATTLRAPRLAARLCCLAARASRRRGTLRTAAGQGLVGGPRLVGVRHHARLDRFGVGRDEWWERASAQEIGDAWQTANAWRDVDPDAQRTTERMRDELRSRYAIDVDSLDADPRAVQEALQRRERAAQLAVEARERAQQEQATAQLLLRDADRADATQDPDGAESDRERAGEHYDSAERRRDMAAKLEQEADAETVEARVVSDTNQARPADEALASGGPQRTPAARRRSALS